jgi:hypothetical protein
MRVRRIWWTIQYYIEITRGDRFSNVGAREPPLIMLRNFQILETPLNGSVNRGELEILASRAVAELGESIGDYPVLFV